MLHTLSKTSVLAASVLSRLLFVCMLLVPLWLVIGWAVRLP
jgi:hypothetical protein